jgi:hypothetical protein
VKKKITREITQQYKQETAEAAKAVDGDVQWTVFTMKLKIQNDSSNNAVIHYSFSCYSNFRNAILQ